MSYDTSTGVKLFVFRFFHKNFRVVGGFFDTQICHSSSTKFQKKKYSTLVALMNVK